MSNSQKLKQLQDILGYHFKDEHWLERALTHSSTNDDYNYQRLEFLGDRVLGLAMADAVFNEFKDENEGGLAKRHTALVQGLTCTIIGQTISLGDYIIFSESERLSGGNSNENIIGDVMESILGAIYIDGGYQKVQKIISTLWGDNIKTLEKAPQDPKTELQEWVQARKLDLPHYKIVGRKGPDHAPIFIVELAIKGQDSIIAQGASRRQTEKEAARQMLKQIKNI